MTWFVLSRALILASAACASLLFLIWFGYPLLVWFRALGSSKTSDVWHGQLPKVSVIVATKEADEDILARIDNLLEAAYPLSLIDIVVAVDFSEGPGRVTALAAKTTAARFVEGDRPGGKAATLNSAVRASSADILVLTDTAQRFEECTVPRLVGCLSAREWGAVSGSLVLHPNTSNLLARVYWTMEKWIRFNESLIHSSVGVTGAVYAIRRELWPTLPSETLLDDLYVPMHLVLAGHRIGFSRAARAHDARVFTPKGEARRKERTLTGVMQLLELLPEVLSSKNPIRWQFLFHKLARLASPVLLAPIGACALVAACFAGLTYPRHVAAVILTLATIGVAYPRAVSVACSACSSFFQIQRAILSALKNARTGNWAVWRR